MDGRRREHDGGDVDDSLALTLGSIYDAAPTPPPSPPPVAAPTLPPSSTPVVFSKLPPVIFVPKLPPSSPLVPHAPPSLLSAPRSTRCRRNSLPPSSPLGSLSTRRRLNNPDASPSLRPRGRGADKANGDEGALLPAPFPWVRADRPALHYTLESLQLKGIMSVEGSATCKHCRVEVPITYDLEAKFREVRDYVAANIHTMDDRAPEQWLRPQLPGCGACGKEACMWPLIPNEKREINWLFLFLGQMLGCCTLDQLKFLCKNTSNHRTGAKNRVLYYAYIEMCRQLEPHGPFNV
ncbi:hypothetical protein E2562_021508 [Oryza meyeriana var. granulata]|uniref:DUF7086 domain-containing protein n=1 Tax=Oryza meyeriana var. granulata TaxID=110450 RepID=A0A6G1DZ38_9ORYZ|nr:hypothetical protein E2562_021508 [Oryza meyeriana var. granulata]